LAAAGPSRGIGIADYTPRAAQLVDWEKGTSRVARGAGPTKNRVEKLLQANLQQTQKPISPGFLLSRFWAFLGKGSSKTLFSMSKTFSKKNEKHFDVSFFLDLFCFIAVSSISQQWEFKPTHKKRFTTEIASKSFCKEFDQTSKTDFPRFSCIMLLGVSR
jgi:hypothetical protein